MTRIIDFNSLEQINSEYRFLISKDKFEIGTLIIAQEEGDGEQFEEWFDVYLVYPDLPLKTGYTMYILTKHNK